MVGQYFLEKRFSRGVGMRRPDKKSVQPIGNDVGGKG
jgi:hypothetical protein